MSLAHKRKDEESFTPHNQNDNSHAPTPEATTQVAEEDLRNGYVHYWLSQNYDLEDA